MIHMILHILVKKRHQSFSLVACFQSNKELTILKQVSDNNVIFFDLKTGVFDILR
jgi:hypothetical protein